MISDALLDELQQRWAPPAHEVFKLVPNEFVDHVQLLYLNLGEPQVSFDSFWNIYYHLIQLLHDQLQDLAFQDVLDWHSGASSQHDQEEIPLIPRLQDLHLGSHNTEMSMENQGFHDGVGQELEVLYADFSNAGSEVGASNDATTDLF